MVPSTGFSIPASTPNLSAGSSAVAGATLSSIDPFRHDSLRRPTVDAIIDKEFLRILGSHDRMHEVASVYFSSISIRIPILSEKRFRKRLPSALSPKRDAEFAALCLCVYLVLEIPQPGDETMQSSLYVSVKSILSLLEATSFRSLEAVQCRVLVAFYEVGHGIYPAAAVSVGACAKLAQVLGLRREIPSFEYGDESDIVAEERRRTWWALHNLDRYDTHREGISSTVDSN